MKIYLYAGLLCFFPMFLRAQVTAQIGTHETPIYPISIQESAFSSQMLPLQALFSAKTIVGMGEATHGSREFFQTKAAVFQWLVNNCQYRVFGIEATYGGCCYINDFVQGGQGSIDSVMFHLDFWTWQTEEVRDLILWIRDYNAVPEHVEKLTFYGFDMQNFYAPMQYLRDFTRQHCPSQCDSLQMISAPVLGKTELQIYQLLQKKGSGFKDTLQQTQQRLATWLQAHKNQLEISQKGNPYPTLQLCVDNLGQAIGSLSVHNQSRFRDSCMAVNVLQIQRLQHQKMFIWAHNGHINLAYPDDSAQLMGKLMGGHLKKQLGDAYYAIGFVFNQGQFQAIQGPKSIGSAIFKYLFARKKLYKGLRACSVPVLAKNTFTQALSATGYPAYFVDVSQSDNPVFSTRLKTYDVGAIFMNSKRCSSAINAKRQFDGIIFLEQTSRARPVRVTGR